MASLIATPALAGQHQNGKQGDHGREGKSHFGWTFDGQFKFPGFHNKQLRWNDVGAACIVVASDKRVDAKQAARVSYHTALTHAWNAYVAARTAARTKYDAAVAAATTDAAKEAAWNTYLAERQAAADVMHQARKAAWDAKQTAVIAAHATYKTEVAACKASAATQ